MLIYDSKQKHPALHTSEHTIVPRTVIFLYQIAQSTSPSPSPEMRGCFHGSWQRWVSRPGRPNDHETRPSMSFYHHQKQPVTLSDEPHKITQVQKYKKTRSTIYRQVPPKVQKDKKTKRQKDRTEKSHHVLYMMYNTNRENFPTKRKEKIRLKVSSFTQVRIEKTFLQKDKKRKNSKSCLCPSSKSTASSHSYQIGIVSEYFRKYLRNSRLSQFLDIFERLWEILSVLQVLDTLNLKAFEKF